MSESISWTVTRSCSNALEKVLALEGVTYELDKHPMDTSDRQPHEKRECDRHNQLGLIAQDVEKVLPQMVRENETTGLQTVGYNGVIPVLVEAIKEQQRQIDEQRTEIAELKKRLR